MNIHIQVQVTLFPTAAGTVQQQGKQVFQLHVQAGSKAWIVERSEDDFVTLQSGLRQDYQTSSFVDISSWKDTDLKHNATDVNVFETFLIRVLTSLGDRVWMTESLVAFLDNVPRKSPMAELQMTRLTQQVSRSTTLLLILIKSPCC